MYVFKYLCMYLSIYEYMNDVCMYVCMYVFKYLCMYLSINGYMNDVCMYVFIDVCICVYLCICMYVCIYIAVECLFFNVAIR
jgi:hypothetical protein